jgi:cytochrome P450
VSVGAAVEAGDLHDDAFARDPFPVWERLRHEAPLFHDTVDDVYLLTRYDDVAAVLADDVTYSTWVYKTSFGKVIGETFAQYDGEQHSRERARVAPHLVGRPLQQLLQPVAAEVADAVVAELPREVDLVGPFTFRLPGLVLAWLFGIDSPEQERFLRLAAEISLGLVGGEREQETGVAARRELEEWTAERIEQRRRDGGADDMLQWLFGADVKGVVLDEEYVKTNVNFLAAAGSSTVDYALRNVLWALFAHPEHADRAGDDPEALDAVITEAFRFAPPVPYEGRIATTEVEWHGHVVPEGATVRIALASATSDESVFANPRQFDPGRADLWAGDSRGGIHREGAASHLAFGLGSHFCPGYKLARLEALEGVARLFRDRRPVLAETLQPLRVRQHHLTLPSIRVRLGDG